MILYNFWGFDDLILFTNLLVRIKLGNTPNVTFLGDLEVEYFGVGSHYCCCSGGITKSTQPSFIFGLGWSFTIK